MFAALMYLVLGVIFLVISTMLAPQQSKSQDEQAGELSAPEANEGSPIPHLRGTRYAQVNCLFWQPEGTKEIKK